MEVTSLRGNEPPLPGAGQTTFIAVSLIFHFDNGADGLWALIHEGRSSFAPAPVLQITLVSRIVNFIFTYRNEIKSKNFADARKHEWSSSSKSMAEVWCDKICFDQLQTCLRQADQESYNT